MIVEIQGLLTRFYEVTGDNLVNMTVPRSVYDQLCHDMASQVVYGCDPSDEPDTIILDGTKIRWC